MAFTKSLGSYPGVLITISLSIALFLIGFCGWIAISSNELIRYVKQNIEVQVFLNAENDSLTNQKIKDYLQKLNLAEEREGSPGVSFISKDAAAEIFLEETKEDYRQILGENPFRASYLLQLKQEFINENNLKNIKTHLEKIPGVYEVEYAKDFLKGIVENINKVYKILALVIFVFFLATILLINNTIKLALYSQRFIIRTMQLVGATDRFIQKPFLKNGIIQGFIASFIAVITLFVLKSLISSQIDGFSIIDNPKSMYVLYLILLILGPIIGFLSTFQSINRYHRMELDKLY
jgi:cell division transport system permease protein